MNKVKIYLVHGYTASDTSNWFPSFKNELENDCVEVVIPKMPNSDQPDFHEWITHLEKSILSFDENTIFVGHSLGCTTILSYLNKNRLSHSIRGLYLVSGFLNECPIPELSSFVKSEIDYQYIINLFKTRTAISAIDDDIIPYDYSERMANKLKAKFILLNKGKHFIDRDNFVEFPFLVNEIRNLII